MSEATKDWEGFQYLVDQMDQGKVDKGYSLICKEELLRTDKLHFYPRYGGLFSPLKPKQLMRLILLLNFMNLTVRFMSTFG